MLTALHSSVNVLEQYHDHLLVVLALLVVNGNGANLVGNLCLTLFGSLNVLPLLSHLLSLQERLVLQCFLVFSQVHLFLFGSS